MMKRYERKSRHILDKLNQSHLIKQYFISQTQNLPNIVEEQETVKTEEENTDNIQNGN